MDPAPAPGTTLAETLSHVLEVAGLGWWHLDLRTGQTRRSPSHDAAFGHETMLPSWSYEDFIAHVHPEDRERVAEAYREAMVGGQEYSVDLRVVWPDGSVHWAFTRGRVVLDADGTPLSVAGVIGDITRAKEAELAALAHLEEASALINSTGDAVVGIRPDTTISNWNLGAQRLWDRPAELVRGCPWHQVMAVDPPGVLGAAIEQALDGITSHEVGGSLRRADGSLCDLSMTVSPVLERGAVVGASVLARDISGTRRLERALEHRALHDQLTGLPNRSLLVDRLGQALSSARRTGRPLAVLFFDLDGFKGVNDVAGHLVGDQLLVEVSRRMAAELRSTDTLARFGGDEFVVLCPDTGLDVATQVSERLHAALAPPVELDGGRYYAPASAGMTVHDARAGDPELPVALLAQQLLTEADLAMYAAKAHRAGSTRVFQEHLAVQARDQLTLTVDLRHALETDGMQLHYQPVVDLASGQVLGLEALARWRNPGSTAVGPGVFVPHAERTGLIGRLDAWALERAARDAATLRDSGVLGPTDKVAVNISARVVQDGSLVEAVTRATSTHGMENLVIEVTETAVLADTETALRDLHALHALGVRMSVDDFGTGQSSLSYLSQLPVSVLKIDQSFVHGMHRSYADLAIVRSVIGLAAEMGLFVVAEGVETQEQFDALRELGCHAGQGWYWTPALPLEQIATWLRERRVG